jgi:hypothetical protein
MVAIIYIGSAAQVLKWLGFVEARVERSLQPTLLHAWAISIHGIQTDLNYVVRVEKWFAFRPNLNLVELTT